MPTIQPFTIPQAPPHVGIPSRSSSPIFSASSQLAIPSWVPTVSPRLDSRCLSGRPPPTATLSSIPGESGLHCLQSCHSIFSSLQKSSSDKSLPGEDLLSQSSVVASASLAPRGPPRRQPSVQRSVSTESLPVVGNQSDSSKVVRFISARSAGAPDFMINTHTRSVGEGPQMFLPASGYMPPQHSSARFSFESRPARVISTTTTTVTPSASPRLVSVSPHMSRGREILSPHVASRSTLASSVSDQAFASSKIVFPASPLPEARLRGSSARFSEKSGRPPPALKGAAVGRRSSSAERSTSSDRGVMGTRSSSAERLSYSDSAGAIGRMFRAATAICDFREESHAHLRPHLYTSPGLSRSSSASSMHSDAPRRLPENVQILCSSNAMSQVGASRTPSCSSTAIAGSDAKATVQDHWSPARNHQKRLLSPALSQRTEPLPVQANVIVATTNGRDGVAESLDAESLVEDWRPYPRRLHSQASVRSQSTDDVQRTASGPGVESSTEIENARIDDPERFEVLYRDNEMRQRRWLARYSEKCQKEDHAVRQLRDHRKVNRTFDRKNFKNWYSERTDHYFREEAARRLKHLSEEEQRLREELAECHPPQIGAPKKSRRAGKVNKEQQKRQAAEELVAAQAAALEALRALGVERDKVDKRSEEDLRMALEDNRKRIERFVKTSDGREMMAERAGKYKELNEGLDDESALKEAQEDLMRASEEKVRTDVSLALQKQTRQEEHRIQLARLQVLRELIHLQKRHEEMLCDENAAWLQSFDLDLVSQIKQEPWYLDARDAAERMIRAEAEIAAEKAAAENARTKPPQTEKTFRI